MEDMPTRAERRTKKHTQKMRVHGARVRQLLGRDAKPPSRPVTQRRRSGS